ncbi:MAG: exodeoxyribonuclease VII large subunit [Alphaproteobacteria bacterium]
MVVDLAHNQPEYTVSELSLSLKRTVETAFGAVRVRGEISGFKRHGSGHCYLRLKDDQAVLDAVIWKGVAGRLSVRPEEGLEVIATGRITTYPGRSSYQIVIESLEVAGVGALLKLLEERRKKLAAEGLFDPARKRRIPFLPEVIGIITSPTGAVIRDILHRLADRCPRPVLLWPVAVQGEGAAAQIAAAIAGFNALRPGGAVPRPDVLIVARGGGSLEDLWPFNEEIVVRAAAASEIPLISAVGHETDTTLIDFASDLRAPTPSAAAEMVVPVRLELVARVAGLDGRMTGAMARTLEDRRVRVEGLGRGLPDPRRILDDATQRLDDRAERLFNAMKVFLNQRRGEVDRLGAQLPAPREHLARKEHAFTQILTRLEHALATVIAERSARFDRVVGRLGPRELLSNLDRHGQDLKRLGERLEAAAARTLETRQDRLLRFAELLTSTSHAAVLNRGFALVRGSDGRVLESSTGAVPGTAWEVEFHDGKVKVTVGGGPSSGRPKRIRPSGGQESLF